MTATQERPADSPAGEVGRDRRRKEDQRLITGRTRWTDNIVLPGMLHLAMVRSPFAHATITNIDVSEAQAAPNVVAVLTGQDVKDEQGGLPNAWPITPEQVTPNHPSIAVDRVTFAGEIVAVIVARSAAEARDAAELVDVDYDELPAALDLKESAEDKVLAHPDLGTNKSAFWQFDSANAGTGGNVDEAIEAARADGIVIEREYRQQRLIPAFMEPRSVVVDPTGEQVTVWSATQIPHILRFLMAAVLGYPESKIRVIAPDVGGGFGGKLQTTPEEWITFMAARRLGKPCKYTETRSESLMAGAPRPRPVAEADPVGQEGRHGHRPQGRAARRHGRLHLAGRRRRPGARRVHVQRDLQVPGVPVQRARRCSPTRPGPTPTAAPAGPRRPTPSSG